MAVPGWRKKFTGALIMANLLVAALLVSVIAAYAVADRKRTIEAAYQDAQNLTDALAEHTRQTLASVDLGISTLTEEIVHLGDDNDSDLHQMLRHRQSVSPATFAFFVIGPNGRLVASSRIRTPEAVDLSDTTGFEFHRDNRDSELFLGSPHKGQVGNARERWIVNMSRRVDGADGQIAGVAAAALSLDYLLDFYRTVKIGEQGVVGLFNPQGILLVRSPSNEAFIGSDFSQRPIFQSLAQQGKHGRFYSAYATDGRARFSAYRRMDENGAIVYVGLGEEEVLDAWRDRLIFIAGFGALAMALFAAGSTLACAYLRRQQDWDEQRAARLKILTDASSDLVQAQGIGALLELAADAARELVGARHAVATFAPHGVVEQATEAVSESAPSAIASDARLRAAALEVPIVSRDGTSLGALALTAHDAGGFSASDRSETVQLANIAAVAIDNLRATAAREAALADVTAAKAAIETIFNSISDAVYALNEEWRLIYLNTEAERLLRREKTALVGVNLWTAFPDLCGSEIEEQYRRARAEGVPVSFEFHYSALETWFSVRAFPYAGGLTVYFQDITQRVETEERLRHAHKMDAVGQLTGGIAHDFNNLLTVILGNIDSVVDYLAYAPQDIRAQAELVRKAAERAGDLTHRLLAFARKQPLDPRQTNINELFGDVEDILTRTLGEGIEVELVRGSGLWKAVIDPYELQNAILNLALNARDAMPQGGRLTIETANICVDSDYAEVHGIHPGQYVMVAVSDTGEGMTHPVLAKAFEPFFTTKASGQGSGLGLSMVYGFARQSGGQAKIYTEPGEGTTVKLYFPRADGETEQGYRSLPAAVFKGGKEHVLVLEDDESVRRLTVAHLHELGYRVSDFSDGDEALAYLEHESGVDLLLTDVVLAGAKSGREVADAAVRKVPALKVLYMSGYTENAIVHQGRLDHGVKLLGKPFRRGDLARKLREVLDEQSTRPAP